MFLDKSIKKNTIIVNHKITFFNIYTSLLLR